MTSASVSSPSLTGQLLAITKALLLPATLKILAAVSIQAVFVVFGLWATSGGLSWLMQQGIIHGGWDLALYWLLVTSVTLWGFFKGFRHYLVWLAALGLTTWHWLEGKAPNYAEAFERVNQPRWGLYVRVLLVQMAVLTLPPLLLSILFPLLSFGNPFLAGLLSVGGGLLGTGVSLIGAWLLLFAYQEVAIPEAPLQSAWAIARRSLALVLKAPWACVLVSLLTVIATNVVVPWLFGILMSLTAITHMLTLWWADRLSQIGPLASVSAVNLPANAAGLAAELTLGAVWAGIAMVLPCLWLTVLYHHIVKQTD